MAPVSTASHRRAIYAVAFVLAAVAMIRRWRSSSWCVLLDAALFLGVLLALPTYLGAWPHENSYPSWFGMAVVAGAYIAFVLIGTDCLRLPAHRLLGVVSLATIAVTMPIVGFDTVRVFAATVPFLAVPLALAVAVIDRRLLQPGRGTYPAPTVGEGGASLRTLFPLLVGGGLIAVTVIGSPVAAAFVNKPDTGSRTCPDGRRAEALIAGTAVRLVEHEPGAEDELEELDVQRVTNAPEIIPLPPIQAPVTVIGGLTENGDDRLAFVDGAVEAPRTSVLYLCGDVVGDRGNVAILELWPQPLDIFVGLPLDAGSGLSSRP